MLPFLLLPILTRYLTPVEYGQVATFQTLANLMGAFIGLNLAGAVSVEKFKGSSDRLPVYVGTCVLITCVAATGFALLLVPFGTWLSDLMALPTSWLAYLVLCGLASAVTSHRLIQWQVDGAPIPYGLFSFGLAAINLGGSLLLVVWLGAGAEGRVAAIVASAAAFGLLAWLLMWRSGVMQMAWDGKAARSALRFSLPLVPHTLAGIAIGQADRLIIGQQLGLAEAGVYAVAMQLTVPVIMVADSFNRAYAPWLFRTLADGRDEVAVAVSAAAAGVYALGTLLYIAAAMFVMPLLVGEHFVAAGSLLLCLAPAIAAQAVYYTVVNFVFYSQRTAAVPVITGAAALMYVTIGYVAVDRYGPVGLAICFSAISVAQTAAIFALAVRVMPMPWFQGSAYARGLRAAARRDDPVAREI